MQQAAWRRKLGDANERIRTLELRCGSLRIELDDARQALGLARAGLLIALPFVEAPPARLLVGVALEQSEVEDRVLSSVHSREGT
jgi:hypothetical protein